jgi:hypothetical protein
MGDYPRLKYQGIEIKPGQHHTENPGFIYQKVNDPGEESALGEGWYDSPREAIEAFRAARSGSNKTEIEKLHARIAELESQQRQPPPQPPPDDPQQLAHGGTSGEAHEDLRQTSTWPRETAPIESEQEPRKRRNR